MLRTARKGSARPFSSTFAGSRSPQTPHSFTFPGVLAGFPAKTAERWEEHLDRGGPPTADYCYKWGFRAGYGPEFPGFGQECPKLEGTGRLDQFRTVLAVQDRQNPAFLFNPRGLGSLSAQSWLKGTVSPETVPRPNCRFWVFWPTKGQKTPVSGWKARN